MLQFSAACPERCDMLTISQSDAPFPTSSGCLPHSEGFPLQMRHGYGGARVGDIDGADRLVDAGSEGGGGDQSAGTQGAPVSSARETSDSHFLERRSLSCR